MEHLIQEFGAWLKQGFGWLVDVIVFGCLWGISQISRLVGTPLGGAPILKIFVLVLVLLLLLYAFYWVFGRFISLIRWALDRIAYALGVILFSAAFLGRSRNQSGRLKHLTSDYVSLVGSRGGPSRSIIVGQRDATSA